MNVTNNLEQGTSKSTLLLVDVAKAKELVRFYSTDWAVLSNKNGKLELVIKDSRNLILDKVYCDRARDFFSKMDNLSKEYVEKLKGSKKELYTSVRSCTLEDVKKLEPNAWPLECLKSIIWKTGYTYWLATKFCDSAYELFYVEPNGHLNWNDVCYECAVRPVVFLKPDVYTIGKDGNGVWILEE